MTKNIHCIPLFLLCVQLFCYGSIAYDCENGCNLDPLIAGGPVCGEDDTTYTNECIAVCQGVSVVKTGRCDTSRTLPFNTEAEKKEGIVPLSVLNRYAAEGFKYVRKLDYTKLTGRPREPIPDESSFQGTDENRSTKNQALRLTHEGHEYLGTFNTESSSGVPRSTDGFDPTKDRRKLRQDERKEAVIGLDDRYRITNTQEYPYVTIGSIGYYSCDGCCSGTLIGPNQVLTAAHCLFDSDIMDWADVFNFAPARNGYSSCDSLMCYTNDPLGTWLTDTITISTAYTDTNGDPNWDVGTISLQRLNGQDAGDVVGYMGFAEFPNYDDPNLQASTITGYSGDKNLEMWSSGSCSFWNDELQDYPHIAFNDCDSTPGSSGSAVLGSDYRARGVVSFEMTDGSKNGALAFIAGSPHFSDVCQWSGMCGNAPTPTVPTPPTPTPPTPTTPTEPKEEECECPCRRLQFLCRLQNSCIFGYTPPADCTISI